MEPKLSICIPVYNQIQIMQKNLDNLLRCERNDIEIVIQDNCSTDDYSRLVRHYDDFRIKLYRNPSNMGHDKNIIAGLKNCRSKFAFLLRSTDTLIPEMIAEVIRFTESNGTIGYCRFSCIDEEKHIRLRYADMISNTESEAIKLNKTILIHPSGELYNLSYFADADWDSILGYLNRYFQHNRTFIVHNLMRDKLSVEAPLATNSEICWLYSDTLKRKDASANSRKDGVCIFAPCYQYERYECELSYIANELRGDCVSHLISDTISKYALAIIFNYKFINKSKKMQEHYRFSEEPFSSRKELRAFRRFTKKLISTMDEQYKVAAEKEIKKINYGWLLCWHVRKYGDRLYRAILAK